MLELLYDTQWTTHTESGGLTTTSTTFRISIRIMRAVGVWGWGAKHVGGESRVAASAPRVGLGTWAAFWHSVDHVHRV